MARRKALAPLNVLINSRLIGRCEKEPSGAMGPQCNLSTRSDSSSFKRAGFIPHLINAAEEHQEIVGKAPSVARLAAEHHIREVARSVRTDEMQAVERATTALLSIS